MKFSKFIGVSLVIGLFVVFASASDAGSNYTIWVKMLTGKTFEFKGNNANNHENCTHNVFIFLLEFLANSH